MAFAKMWPFLFLLLIPAIILLYLLKQKSVDYKVASLYLWKEAYKNNTATTPFQKFRNNLLMYLQIITVIVLIAALASPFIKNFGDEQQDAVIVIDTSASMRRMYDSKNTRLQEAKDAANDYIDNMMNNSSITIVTVSNIAEVCVSNADDKNVAKKAVKDIKQTDLKGNMDSAVNLVYALTNGNNDIQVVIFSDNADSFTGDNAKVVDMQTGTDNAYVSLVSHSVSEKGLNVLVTLNNDSNKTLNTDVNLYGDDKMIAVEKATVEAGKSSSVIFNDVNFSGDVLWAEINKNDALDKDNIYYDKVNDRNQARTLFVTEQNVFMEKVLLACGNFELLKANSIDSISDTDVYDLYVFDGMVPDKLPEKGSILFMNCNYDKLFQSTGSSTGGMVTIKPTEYTKYLDNYTFGVNAYKEFTTPEWAQSFMTIGDKDIAFMGNYDGRSLAAIGFDLHDSQFPLEAEFPILFSQLLSRLIDSDFVGDTNVIAGDAVPINGKIDGNKMYVINCENGDVAAEYEAGNAYFSNSDTAGIYKVKQETDEKTLEEKFVVNFPVSESVDTASSSSEDNSVVSVGDIKGDFNLRPYIILACIFCLMIEWIIYLRKL